MLRSENIETQTERMDTDPMHRSMCMESGVNAENLSRVLKNTAMILETPRRKDLKGRDSVESTSWKMIQDDKEHMT